MAGSRPFAQPPHRAVGAALLRLIPGLSDRYTWSKGLRFARRRSERDARGLVVAPRRPGGGKGPRVTSGWLTFDVEVRVDDERHDMTWAIGNRPRWIPVPGGDDGDDPTRVVVRLYSIATPDPELRVEFDVPPGRVVLLVEVTPGIVGYPRGPMPPSIRVRDRDLSVLDETRGSTESRTEQR